jgi:polar amino acid transport system substrate-binding protein
LYLGLFGRRVRGSASAGPRRGGLNILNAGPAIGGRTMTRLVAALLGLISLLAAVNSAGAGEKIRLATEGYYAPFNYFDESGKLAGFDVDIGNALCKEMEADCEFVQQDWDNLIPSLLEGKYDVIVASMSITEEREEKVSFTIPYYSNMLTFIGKINSGVEISNEGLESKSVGTLRSTVSADYLEENYSGIVNIRLYDTQDEALADLAAGKLDLVLGDNLPSYSWLQTDAGKNHEFIGEFIDIDDRISIAVRKNDESLREKLDQALIAILEDGTYQEINEKYFPFSIYF